ncbi:hypothetical protein OG444_30875 [Streptomyces sp. NBC_01232]|uniref:hypothetical protein n=1 Tax=Streptomyces sp. NBC_01232 TaxID=2903786 RepID=UPI002E111D33|nr:hypothetical protein OG444_30875 [Streptomyces sp. NBC_01232]
MPHKPAIHHPEPITWYPAPTDHPTHPVPVLEEQAGIQLVTLPNGTRTLAYTHPTPIEPAPAPAPAAGIPAWAKTTALLAPTLGGGIGAAGIGISYAAPGLIALTEALWALAALIAVGALAPLLLKATRGTGRGTAPVQHITQHISASGLFGRANGTLNR